MTERSPRPFTHFGEVYSPLKAELKVSTMSLARDFEAIPYRAVQFLNEITRDTKKIKQTARRNPEFFHTVIDNLAHFFAAEKADEDNEMYVNLYNTYRENMQDAVFEDIGRSCEWNSPKNVQLLPNNTT